MSRESRDDVDEENPDLLDEEDDDEDTNGDDDPDADDSDPTDDTGSDTRDFVGHASLLLISTGCPDCFADVDSNFTGFATAHFPGTPSPEPHNSYLPPRETCVDMDVAAYEDTPWVDGGQIEILLDGVATPLLASNAAPYGIAHEAEVDATQLAFAATRTLHRVDSGETLNDLFATPAPLTDVAPASLLNPVATAFTAPLLRSGFPMSWSADEPGDLVIIEVRAYDAVDQTYLGQVFCTAHDDGAFTVTGLDRFPSGSIAVVILARANLAEVSASAGRFEGMAQYRLAGTGMID